MDSCRLACREDDRRTLYGACGGSNTADSSEPKIHAGGDAGFRIQLSLLPDDRIWRGQSHFEERQQASKGLSGSRSGIFRPPRKKSADLGSSRCEVDIKRVYDARNPARKPVKRRPDTTDMPFVSLILHAVCFAYPCGMLNYYYRDAA